MYFQASNSVKLKGTEKIIANHHNNLRKLNKEVVSLKEAHDASIDRHRVTLEDHGYLVRAAVHQAKIVERQHHAKLVEKEKEKVLSMQCKLDAKELALEALTGKLMCAERDARNNLTKEACAVCRTCDVTTSLDNTRNLLNAALSREAKLAGSVAELQEMVDDSTKKLSEMSSDLEAAVPIPTIGMIRSGRGGSSHWPTHIWELILDQLVKGVPPSAVSDNIVDFVKTFSPSTDIKQVPSLYTVRRARTVLLVVVQTLASYRLAKSNKWGQLFTDATSRRQVSFQNLVISIEEDELFQ